MSNDAATAKKSLFTNAAWNIAAGASGAVSALLLPPVLTRVMSPDAYGAWALTLQIAGYLMLLTFGIQVAVGRFVAMAEAQGSRRMRDQLVSTAVAVMVVSGLVGWIVLSIGAVHIDSLFPDLPRDLAGPTGRALMLVSAGLALSLPGMVFVGVFLGEQRAHISGMVLASGRLFQALAVVAVAALSPQLGLIAGAHLAGAVLLVSTLVWVWRRRTLAPRFSISLVTRESLSMLWGHCAVIALWQAAMLIISGVDLIIVARIAFDTVPYYAVAATLIAVFVGLLSAVYNAFLPVAARYYAAGDRRRLLLFLRRGLRGGFTLSLVAGLPLILFGEEILSLWVPRDYAVRAAPYLSILAVAQIIRMSVMMYVIVSLATGKHNRMVAGPVLEAIANLVLSIALGIWLGPIGVALGTALSAVIGATAWLLRDPLYPSVVALRTMPMAIKDLARPLIVLVGASIGISILATIASADWAEPVVGVLALIFIAWLFALRASDRRAIFREWIKDGKFSAISPP